MSPGLPQYLQRPSRLRRSFSSWVSGPRRTERSIRSPVGVVVVVAVVLFLVTAGAEAMRCFVYPEEDVVTFQSDALTFHRRVFGFWSRDINLVRVGGTSSCTTSNFSSLLISSIRAAPIASSSYRVSGAIRW